MNKKIGNNKRYDTISLRHLLVHFAGSTIARSSLLLGAAVGAFIGTITLYFVSLDRGIAIDSSLIFTFTLTGATLGLATDLAINLVAFIKKR